jgi:hypothetical protein
MATTLAKEDLNHSRMITNVVSRPGSSILHCPSFLRNFLGFSNQCIDSDLEFLIFPLHCSPLPDKVWCHLIFQVVYLLLEVPFWGTRLETVPFAERNPLLCKFRCFRQCFKCQHGSPIIRNIARDLVDRIIYRKDRQNSICCDQGRLLHGINRTDKKINWGELRLLAFLVKPQCQPVKVSFPLNRKPLWELIKNPRHGEPDFTDDGYEP